MANVRFLSVKTLDSYLALQTKEPTALYWVQENSSLYKGDQLFGTGALASEVAAGLLSAEDYASLKALIASGGGIAGLRPVDGTISITDVDGGKALGVAVSTEPGNLVAVKSDGLFVAPIAVPEYTIERQPTAESGYAATYKLKRTVNGASTYVGDPINVIKDLVISKGSLETVATDGVPYDSALVGDPYLDLVLNDAEQSHVYIPVKGLIDTYVAGNGIEIVNNVVSVKLADNTHGLVAVDGALSINLATHETDGALSKEDKTFLDALRELNISGEYVTKAEVQEIKETVVQSQQAYTWGEL